MYKVIDQSDVQHVILDFVFAWVVCIFVDPGTKVWSEWETQLPMQIYLCCRVLRLLILPVWAFCWMQSTQQLKPDPHSPSQSWLWQFVCTTSSFMGLCWTVGLIRMTHALIWPHLSRSAKEEQRPPQWTSTHQCIIHWIPVSTQLWMNLNWVNIWFCFSNQFCRK
jgi:hypothetical protein